MRCRVLTASNKQKPRASKPKNDVSKHARKNKQKTFAVSALKYLLSLAVKILACVSGSFIKKHNACMTRRTPKQDATLYYTTFLANERQSNYHHLSYHSDMINALIDTRMCLKEALNSTYKME